MIFIKLVYSELKYTSLIQIIIKEENFKWHLEAFASELFIYIKYPENLSNCIAKPWHHHSRFLQRKSSENHVCKPKII